MEILYKNNLYLIDKIEDEKYKVRNIESAYEYELNEEEFTKFKRITSPKFHNNYEIPLVSNYNNLIQFESFQYKPYLKLKQQGPEKCIYIADEVGVGKTFEVGILISEFLYSGEISLNSNILIVCPNMLCRKWQMILKEFFGLATSIIKNVNEARGISIISYNNISNQTIENDLSFKLLIVDEAHNINGKRFERLFEIRQKSVSVILISATPLAGKEKDFKKQVLFLFGNEEKYKFFLQATVGENVIEEDFFKKDGLYFNRTLKDEMREGEVCREINIIVTSNGALEAYVELCNRLFIHKNTLRRYVGLNMISSSPAAARAYYNQIKNLNNDQIKKLLLDANGDKGFLDEHGLSDDGDSDLNGIEELDITISDGDIDQIKKIIEYMGYKFGMDPNKDDKLNKVKDIISKNTQKANSNDPYAKFYKKVVIFTNYNSTAYYLGENIDNSIVINGELDESEKWRRFNLFKDTTSTKDVLIITNVACEGQDMDFCNTLINYDLTYNPVQLVQRMGRVDRFEIKKPKVYIYNFTYNNIDPTENEIKAYLNGEGHLEKYQNSVYPVLLKKLQNIKESTGIYYNIVDNVGCSNVEINKIAAQKGVCKLFENFYKDKKIESLSDIKDLYKSLKKERQEVLKNILLTNGYEIESNSNGDTLIDIEKGKNQQLLNVLDGGTLNSHLIYNK